ncbi:MAG TPA: DEAD/DEAH box helicase [Salinarimonas sp.]|nr:DEAD/DEAH box helicase [Salinarimonas sp.]
MTQFKDLGLAEPIMKALRTEGYETPTPIQVKAIPPVMEGRDLIGIAQTGTGKTAAFALPILHRLSLAPKRPPLKGCRVLVLSPTRELASQIADSFQAYGRNLRLSTTVVFGGVPLGRQERTLANGVDILVATPGRLLDLVDRRSLTLSGVEILVLDEADQMLDLGFIHALKRIVTLVPKKRQTLFFSATMPRTIRALADDYINDPVEVAVTPVATTAERVTQQVMFVAQGQKQGLLAHVLKDPEVDRALVFTRTKHGADKVVRGLEKAGIEAAAIHGNKSQSQRERALGAFRDGRCRVLIATDIAARGIDVEGVSHVVNFELPNVPESYVHRIGRTARAGADGLAISFCNGEERAYLKDIEKLTRQKVPVMPLPAGFHAEPETAAPAAPQPGARPAGRGGPGRPGGQPRGGQFARGPRPASAPPQGAKPAGRNNRRRGGGGGQGQAAGR